MMAKERILLKGNFIGFYQNIIELTKRMPMDINLLCHFAYDYATTRFSQRESVVELYFKINKSVLDNAINELRGTREYSQFITSLTSFEINCLVILSYSMYPLTANELQILLFLDELGEGLTNIKIGDLCNELEKIDRNLEVVENSINKIIQNGEKLNIKAISKNIIGRPMYVSNDQWLGAYFKIGWAQKSFDLDKGFLPVFQGVRMFRDPIASILHSVFFPRVAEYLKKARPFKVRSDKGSSVRFRMPKSIREKRKYLAIDYQRNADNLNYYYILNLHKDCDVLSIKNNVLHLLSVLKRKQLVNKVTAAILG